MLDGEGRAKLADFGIARLASANATPGTTSIMGTAHYLSPEQAEGGPVDGRADVYSLGVVLFELLTGWPPFQGDSAVAVAVQHVQATPPSPRTLRADLSPAAERIVLRALAKNPADRFESAVEMHEALVAARRESATVPLRTVRVPRATAELSATRRMSHPAPRLMRRGLVPLLGLSALLLLVAGVVVLARGGRVPETGSSAPVTTQPVPTDVPLLATVPDLSGASQEGAADQAPSSVASAGDVVDQNPGVSEAVPGGNDVAVTSSSAPPASTTRALAPASQLPPGHAKPKPGKARGHE